MLRRGGSAYAAWVTPVALPSLTELLAEAEARLRRRRAYARPLAGRPGKARHLDGAIEAARDALARHAAPGAVWRPVPCTATGGRVRLAEVTLDSPRLSGLLAGGTALVWLCTLGEDQAGLATRAQGDYMLTHVIGDLAQATLYAAARAVQRDLVLAHPASRLVRVSLREAETERWDVPMVGRLLPLLGCDPLGVRPTGSGGFTPVHTLLGVTVARPGGGAP